MADKGSLLTSVIIFYLSIGATVFHLLEEPNWRNAVQKYQEDKEQILRTHPCLTKEQLDTIIEMVAKAAGQGVTITGEKPYNPWIWQNAVIFAATIITTIGYGQVAPKTTGGRGFCIIFGLCGIPLCLTWISELGTFFGSRTKRLSQALLHRRFSVKKVQFICTTLFLLWGLLFHLIIPPLIFMCMENWTYLEGLYFCFITLTTVGFGDYVAGVNTGLEYKAPYRFCVELWIYMGLAWLSLFFSWNVNMVVEAHKVLKKRRQMHRHKLSPDQLEQMHKASLPHAPSIVDIFKFMSEKGKDYSDVIRAIGTAEKKKKQQEDELTRSKSCSDLLKQMVVPMEHSPRQKRRFSIGDNVYMVISRARGSTGDLEESTPLQEEPSQALAQGKKCSEKELVKRSGSLVLEPRNVFQRSVQIPSFRFSFDNDASGTQEGTLRFSVTRVNEDLLEKGEGPG
ncbi:potassium channel subfamily K member 5b [Tachysurus fulvidraco]|uniref:potassium channel subfamily K member 5b n=1 Tax=Tachysurus fulvidraco TaxID=1234273 RepID=UPI001FEF038B|nr:potassium channel subfamily K member 5b [Tachysurus fulvidraco]